MAKECRSCGVSNVDSMAICGNCGAPLPTDVAKSLSSGAVHLDIMDSDEFEATCKRLLERTGYTISTRIRGNLDKSIEFAASGPDGPTAVECRHNPRSPVDKSVIQRFHSSMLSSGLRIGLVITTGEFTESAREYARNLLQTGVSVRLIGKALLADMATRAGVELISHGERMSIQTYVVLEQGLLKKAFQQFYDNTFDSHPTKPSEMVRIGPRQMRLTPANKVQYNIDATFKTSVGILHRESHNGTLFVSGLDGKPLRNNICEFFSSLPQEAYSPETFSYWHPETNAFEMSIQETREIAEREIVNRHTRRISYVGLNGHLYEKLCEPKRKDVRLTGIQQVYVPLSEVQVSVREKSFNVRFVDHASGFLTILDDVIIRCDVCGKPVKDEKPYICNRCGACCHPMTNSHGDGFKCKSCGTTLCRACTVFRRKYIVFKKPFCKECDDRLTELKRNGKRIAAESTTTSKRALRTKMKPDDRTEGN